MLKDSGISQAETDWWVWLLEMCQNKCMKGYFTSISLFYLMDGGLWFHCWLTLHRNLQSVWTYQAWKTIWKGGPRGTDENKKVLSLFPAWRAHYSSSSPLSQMHTPSSSKLLHFFSSRLTSPQAHTVRVTNPGFSSTVAPPPFSHWLFYSLILVAAAPSFPFSSPLLFSSPLFAGLHTPNQLTAKELLCPSHTNGALNQSSPLKNWDHTPKEVTVRA